MNIFKRLIILIIFISIPTLSYSAEMHGNASQPKKVKDTKAKKLGTKHYKKCGHKGKKRCLRHNINDEYNRENKRKYEEEKSRKPKVKMTEIQVEGNFTKMEVKKIVARNLVRIRNCYHRELNKNPNIKGELVIEWRINSSGRVPYAQILKSNLKNKRIEKCIKNQILKFYFKTKNTLDLTSVTKVKYQFMFRYIKN